MSEDLYSMDMDKYHDFKRHSENSKIKNIFLRWKSASVCFNKEKVLAGSFSKYQILYFVKLRQRDGH